MIVDAGNPAVLQTHIDVDGNSDKHDADIYAAVYFSIVWSHKSCVAKMRPST